METVGQATWAHSVRSLKPGGRIVICGATSGDAPPAELTRIFFTQLSVTGSTMGTRDQLARLARFCEQTGVRPVIDRVLPLENARDGFEAMIAGDLFGKVVCASRPLAGSEPGESCGPVLARRAARPGLRPGLARRGPGRNRRSRS